MLIFRVGELENKCLTLRILYVVQPCYFTPESFYTRKQQLQLQILYLGNHIDFILYIENEYQIVLKSKACYKKWKRSEIKVSGLEKIRTTVNFLFMFCCVLKTQGSFSNTKLSLQAHTFQFK